ncbi:MAG: FtsW/RodA/SpoVE family cell cycle protein [Phycisphaeraceae bacterium]
MSSMLRPAHLIQLAAASLLAIGVVMVQSAAMTIGGGARSASLASLLSSRHLLLAGLAVVAMLVASRIDIRQGFRSRTLLNPLFLALLVSLALAGLTLVPGMGRSVNGSSRWLELGGFSFQPSELVKWTMIPFLAWWCARRRGAMGRFFTGLLPPLIIVGGACAIIVIEDLGTAALIGAVAGCLLLAGGAAWWQLGMLVPLAGAGVVVAILQAPYRVARLTAFRDPWADPAGAGYHAIQSMVTIAQGGLTGRGVGNGIQKFGYVPEDTTDFIFSIVCEELGLAGAGLVVGLYLVILWVGLGIVRDCRDTFARLVGLGVLLTVGLQVTVNVAVVTVVVPTKGIALPLVSSGGTGWVLTAFALGLLASLDNARELGIDGDELPTLSAEPA